MKKVLSMLLVLTLVLGMSTMASAYKVPEVDKGFSTALKLSGGEYAFSETEARPGQGYSFTLATAPAVQAFKLTTSANSENTLATTGYDKKQLTTKVTSRIRVSKGSNAIAKAELKYDKTAQIYVEFVNPFVSNNTDGQEFDIWVYPVVDGKALAYETYGAHFTGTLKNFEYDVTSGTDYVDLYNHQIAVIKDQIRAIKYDLGPEGSSSDIILNGRAIKGQKYYGRANNDVSEADAEIMDTHKINQVYHLQQAGGLDKVTNSVTIATATKNDFIFDGELKFLGKGDSKTIPYASTYYIADHMIEVASDEEPIAEDPTDETVDPIAEIPQTGGNVSAPAGIFQNPSTGA